MDPFPDLPKGKTLGIGLVLCLVMFLIVAILIVAALSGVDVMGPVNPGSGCPGCGQ